MMFLLTLPCRLHKMSLCGVLTRNAEMADRMSELNNEAKTTSVNLGSSGFLVMMVTGSRTSLTTRPHPATTHGPVGADRLAVAYGNGGADFMASEDAHVAAALWDTTSKTLHLYRGRTGIPPLFYWEMEDGLAWATTIRDLVRLGAPRDIDRLALAEYQRAGFIQAPRTMLKAVRKLPAFHRLTRCAGETEIARYWTPVWEPKAERDIEKQADDVERILARSIAGAMPSTGRLGVLLSGGIDSVCLAAVASRRSGADVTGFTFDYSDYDGIYNEAAVARTVASHLEIEHEVIPIDAQYVIESLPRLIAMYEEPFSYGIHSARLDPLRARGIDVAISGAVGGHWALTGAWKKATRVHHAVPRSLLQAGSRLSTRMPRGARRFATGLRLFAMTDTSRYLAMSQQVLLSDSAMASLWASPQVIMSEARETMESDLAQTIPSVGLPDRFALLGLASFGAEHLAWWNHRWAEGAEISVRFPYMEAGYVEYLGCLRDRKPDSPERRLLASRYLPHDLAHAPKLPQKLPLGAWLAGPLHEFARDVLSKQAIEEDGTFDFNEVNRRLDAHRAGQEDHRWSIWTVLSYLVWKREFLDRIALTK